MRVRSLVLVLVLAVAGCGPRSTPVAAPSASVAAPNGVDLLFAQMMVVHHAQAVQLSRIVSAEPGVSERVRNVAGFIAHDQQREIDETNAWLVAWGRPAVDPADPVVRQLHGGRDAAAHGMLSDAQLDQVRDAAPTEASRLFLQQMIAHHTGAITMARSALEDGGNAYIRTLATHIINEQTAENDAMRALLVTPPPG
ncbi:DUF305 domain-containing protein [Actinoplanes sp. NPDC048791]|uniref:DUF305 domain-containing protein n=1 Tax=Actinoplanes sp. NPDC048791 TaxID=3154623 RepID=UPI0033E43E7A